MNIIEAIEDDRLFRKVLGGHLDSWSAWITALKAVYGLPLSPRKDAALFKRCTNRDYQLLPRDGFSTALFLTGRRSGKSRVSALVAAFEAVLAGKEKRLAPGEMGLVVVVSPTKEQSRIVHRYLRAIFDEPLLRKQIVSEQRHGFTLRNNVRIEILAGDFRSIRGYTLLCTVVDEACFFGVDEESRVRSDTELIRAIKPSLATVDGRLIAISSPYARKGWAYAQHAKYFGSNTATTLVWNCPSRTMNPTLPQRVVDEAYREDLQAAKSEYGGEFRDDIAAFIPSDLLQPLVVKGRQYNLPRYGTKYVAFADLSGGRKDDAALAIAHRENRVVVLDRLQRWKPPFSPYDVIGEMTDICRKYQVYTVRGDQYAGEFVGRAFNNHGISYGPAKKNKSELYLDLLPRLCSGQVELLDDPHLLKQLSGLERRTRSGGRDIIDHATGGHDDLANVVAGVAYTAMRPVLGAMV